MIAAMSDSDGIRENQPSVLSSLPKTRPQRPSARRAAARSIAVKPARRPKSATSEPPTPKPKASKQKPPATKARKTPSAAKRAAKPARPATSAQPTAPRQGFEADSDLPTGTTVEPPSSTEILTSVVDLLGDLTQSSLSGGGRLFKDALTRLLRP
jgi:hypothetical protein